MLLALQSGAAGSSHIVSQHRCDSGGLVCTLRCFYCVLPKPWELATKLWRRMGDRPALNSPDGLVPAVVQHQVGITLHAQLVSPVCGEQAVGGTAQQQHNRMMQRSQHCESSELVRCSTCIVQTTLYKPNCTQGGCRTSSNSDASSPGFCIA